MRKSIFCLVSILLVISAGSAMGQNLIISDQDKKPQIIADFGSGGSSFSKTITITLQDGIAAEEDLIASPGDLGEVGGTNLIDRKYIQVSQTKLKKDKPQDVTITVSNLPAFGAYTSVIKLGVASKPAITEIVLTVNVKAKVDVKVLGPTSAQLIRCSPFPCALTRWLPDKLLGQTRTLLLDNATPVGLKVMQISSPFYGEKSGYSIDDVKLEVPNGRLEANNATAGQITFPETDSLTPDHFVGTIRYGLEGYSPQSVNYTLDVRDSPWWALLFLLLGVVVGRIVNKLNSPEAVAQVQLLKRVFALEKKVVKLPPRKEQTKLLADLVEIKERINENEKESVITQELDKIESRANLLRQLEDLIPQIAMIQDPALKAELITKAEEARLALRQDKLDDCLTTIKAIEARLEEIPDGGEEIANALLSVKEMNKEGARARAAQEGAEPRSRFVRRALAFLTGTGPLMSAEVQLWLLRPIVFLLLLVMLVLVGLKTGYVDKATFGSEGFFDYLGLFMWGLTADVAQRTLQNLRLPGGPV
ncbi:MAG: hypothetical protein ACRD9S_03475 [Pyrinomonadaceae bacterium]